MSKHKTQMTQKKLDQVSGGRAWPGGMVYSRIHPNQFFDPKSILEKFNNKNKTHGDCE